MSQRNPPSYDRSSVYAASVTPHQDQFEPSTSRPVGIMVTIVLSALMGFWGLVTSLFAGISLLLGEQMNELLVSQGSEEQKQMQRSIQEAVEPFFIPNIISVVVALGVSGCLLVTAFGLATSKPWSLPWARKTFIAAIALELFRSGIGVLTQVKTIPIVGKFMEQTSGASFPMTQIMMIASLVMIVVWLAIKIGVISWGIFYLNKPRIKAYFQVT